MSLLIVTEPGSVFSMWHNGRKTDSYNNCQGTNATFSLQLACTARSNFSLTVNLSWKQTGRLGSYKVRTMVVEVIVDTLGENWMLHCLLRMQGNKWDQANSWNCLYQSKAILSEQNIAWRANQSRSEQSRTENMQIRPDQTRSDQIRSDQIRLDQIRSD